MYREEATDLILEAKKEKGLAFEAIANENEKGDRVRITYEGRFLPYEW